MGGAAVDDDVAGSGFSGLDVGFEAVARGDGGDEDFFAFPEACGFHEVGGDFDAAFVIHIGVGDHGAVDFGFENLMKHGGAGNPERGAASSGGEWGGGNFRSDFPGGAAKVLKTPIDGPYDPDLNFVFRADDSGILSGA